MRIPFEVVNNRRRIMGIMNLPFCFSETRIFVILCYGMNGNRVEANRLFVKEAEYLEKRGIAFVRFDYLGLGISDGDFFEADLDTKVSDVVCVVNYIRNCCMNEKCRIVLMGISDGAKVINKIVLEKKIDINDIILLNPVLVLGETEHEDSGEKNTKKKVTVPIVKHPIIGKRAILKEGQFFSPKHMMQCSSDYNVFDVTNKNVVCFFSKKDDLSLLTRKKMEKVSCSIKEIDSCSHVFVENDAQYELFEETYKLLSDLKGMVN